MSRQQQQQQHTPQDYMLLDEEMFCGLELGIASLDAGKPVKQPTLVYRVEMPNGNGPYNSGLPNAEAIYGRLQRFGCERLATANNENMDVTSAQFHFQHHHAQYACEDLAAVESWFSASARRYLKTLGAAVAVYEVQPGQALLTVGNGEVVFSKPDARRVKTLDVVSLKEVCHG